MKSGLIKDQHHERFIGHVPLTPDVMTICRNKTEARIVLRMADNDDKRAAAVVKPLDSLTNQFRADAPSLELRHH